MQGSNDEIRVRNAPSTLKQRLHWLGPGVIWLAAGAGGAGELLFPPRVGSLYGYAFLWILILSIFLKWVIVREIGRWAACTGTSFMDGLKKLDHSYAWPVWLIVLPQIVIGSASVAGLAGSAATALILFVDIDIRIWAGVAILTGTALLLLGRYNVIEKTATIVTSILAVAAVIAAISVFPEPGKIVQGLIPSVPSNVDYQEVLPWLSYVLAGSAGMIWYSYWLPAKGYGASEISGDEKTFSVDDHEGRQQLKGWISQMTLDISLGFIAGTVIVVAFLILGVELLRPEKIVPEENKVAETLGGMMGNIWGKTGYWFMIIGVFAGFWGTVVTNQDGWARMLANGTRLLFPNAKQGWMQDEPFIKKVFLVIVLTILPVLIYIAAGEPVLLLQIGGIVQILFIPFVAWFVLKMNRVFLPESLRPSAKTIWLIYGAIFFYTICILAYFYQLIG